MRSRSIGFCMIALLVAFILVCQSVAALPILSIPYARAGPCFYLNPSEVADLFILEANTSHVAMDNSEALAISFTPTVTGSPGVLTVAPSIAQTSSQTIACDRTYFFQDFTVQ